ncbi:helix-turn-helix domain-containing protein [Flavobacterium sp. ARAG 55.4]|uniref:helix-turn-helix domain-containing protein n=1 Tax=Flavobacterium sp. ARAG 55.4 TaxID=3451357 RepID=UPI003F47B225
MVNTDDFIKRLEVILEYYGVNASAFADKIGVQRSSLSHLLSGRNKPSLDFILKILEVYPEVDLYWLLNGKGTFPKNNSVPTEAEAISSFSDTRTAIKEDLFSQSFQGTIEEDKKETVAEKKPEITAHFFEETIDKIVFFYKDGTFKTYSANQKK